MAVEIKYNNAVITSLSGGQTATLPCAEKLMMSDIVITAPEDSALPIEVATEAEMTALLTSGEVGGVYKYTGTTGTYENGALYVLEEEAAATITFTIDGTSYQAEEGMTWAEWVESEYHSPSIVIAYNGNIVSGGSYLCTSSSISTKVLTTDTVTPSAAYYLVNNEPT